MFCVIVNLLRNLHQNDILKVHHADYQEFESSNVLQAENLEKVMVTGTQIAGDGDDFRLDVNTQSSPVSFAQYHQVLSFDLLKIQSLGVSIMYILHMMIN